MDFQSLLESIYEEVLPLVGQGKVADYIPALQAVSPEKLGIALETIDGRSFAVGDAQENFSIQSISKVFNLALGIHTAGQELWERVGREPSGNPFNSLIQLEYENGIPRNPFINAGALVVVDVLLDELARPNDEMLAFVNRLRCSQIQYDDEVARSEIATAFTNRALVNFMKAHNNIKHEDTAILDAYCHQCAISMSCVALAQSFLFLANNGVVPASGERILSVSETKRVNAIMLTCGFYDQAGDFAYLVGLPGKSGVGGGIVAVIPGELSIAVWSPELNAHGNSLIGIKVLELFTTRTGLSIF